MEAAEAGGGEPAEVELEPGSDNFQCDLGEAEKVVSTGLALWVTVSFNSCSKYSAKCDLWQHGKHHILVPSALGKPPMELT